jgi:DNA-binding Lrp family transcriptional regulator
VPHQVEAAGDGERGEEGRGSGEEGSNASRNHDGHGGVAECQAADTLGLSFEALVFITMRQEDRDTLMGFEEGVAAIPHVLQAQRLFGDPDYLLRIVTTDLAAYQRLQDEKLSALPGVQRMTSTLVMKRIVNDRPLPA